MEAKLTREQANELLHKYVKGENYITHSYAVEAIMRGLAKKLAPDDVEYWGICGLLHDLDEETAPWRDDFGTHGPTSAKILREEGFGDPVMENAIMSHNPACGKTCLFESLVNRFMFYTCNLFVRIDLCDRFQES